jgi:hypothetical protein
VTCGTAAAERFAGPFFGGLFAPEVEAFLAAGLADFATGFADDLTDADAGVLLAFGIGTPRVVNLIRR